MTDEQTLDRFDRYGALWLLCARYHTGQTSRGYRLLGRLENAGYKPGASIWANRFESDAQRDYYRRWYPLRDTL